MVKSTRILQPAEVQIAAELLQKGELVAFPTETVYGLGACLFNESALHSIFAAKRRPIDNPLIVHICSLEQVREIARDIPDTFFPLAQAFFPGPLTLILKRASHVPACVSAGLDTIAVRMPAHFVARELIRHVKQPIAAPSANLSGKPSATLAKHVLEDFDGKISAVIDGGQTELGIESTVLNLTEEIPILMRPGSIEKEEIEKVLKCPISTEKTQLNCSPGMKYRHYAPKTPLYIVSSTQELENRLAERGKILLLSSNQNVKLPKLLNKKIDHYPLSAKELYAHLRLADEKKYQQIVIWCNDPISSALMNRLTRAAEKEKNESCCFGSNRGCKPF